MVEILKKLSELVLICENRLKQFSLDEALFNSKSQELANRIKECEEKEASLNRREEKIKESEAVGKVMEEVIQMRAQASDKLTVISKDREKLSIEKTTHSKQVTADFADIARQKDKLSIDRQSLEEERKNYRRQIMDQITSELTNKAKN